MALDPSISLGIRPVKVEGPMESFQKTMALKGMLDQQAMNRQLMGLRAQEAEKTRIETENLRFAQEGRQVFSDVMKKHISPNPKGGVDYDWPGARQDLINSGHPEIADQLLKYEREIEAQTDTHLKEQLDNHVKGATATNNLFGSFADLDDTKAADPAVAQDYAARVNQWQQGGLDKVPGVTAPPQQWGPDARAWAKQQRDDAMSATQQAQLWNAKKLGEEAASKSDIEKRKNESQTIDTLANEDAYTQAIADKKIDPSWGPTLKDARAAVARLKAGESSNEAEINYQRFLQGQAGQNPEIDPETKKPYTADPQGFRKMNADITARTGAAARKPEQQARLTEETYKGVVSEVKKDREATMGNMKDFDAVQRLIQNKDAFSDEQVTIKLVQALAAGSGSGFRMTNTELDRAGVPKNLWEQWASAISKLSLDPNATVKFPPASREQLQRIVDQMQERGQQLTEKYKQFDSETLDAYQKQDPLALHKARVNLTDGINSVLSFGEKTPAKTGGKTVTFGGKQYSEGDSITFKGPDGKPVTKKIKTITGPNNVIWDE